MNRYSLLLKKQFFDAVPLNSKQLSKNLARYALGVLLVACVVTAFGFIFSKFTETYTQIKINRVPNVAERQFEVMSTVYFAMIIAFTVTGTMRLCHTLFENGDINILITMPFSPFEIFASKLTWLYIRQAIMSLVAVLTVNLSFFITTDLVSAYNVLMSFVVGLILPIFPLSIAALLALPYYYIKRIIASHYLINFAVMTALLAGFCVLYAYLFGIAENLVGSGKLASLFNENTMLRINAFAANAYPANLIAGIMLRRDVGKNFGILVAILLGVLAIGLPTIHAIFIRVTQKGFAARVPHIRYKKPLFIKRGGLLGLIHKEFILVLRTSGYAYMYFATAIIMPIMTYYSARLGSELIGGIMGNIRFDFELCTFIVLLYSTLTNTFCSTNISRDGYMATVQKTLPYSPTQILSSKMIFSGIVSELSIIVACIVLVSTKLESPVDGLITFISSSLLAAAQIALATRLDLDRPHFSRTDDGEIKEANSTVSVIILVGLAVCFAMGVLLLYNALKGLITNEAVASSIGASYALAICIPLALLGGALAYFFVNLKKAYANLDAER
ncbi:MAG: hypothetical protein NC037_05245 [Bacteroides sp.]|nr:hypothetical protein [Bacillota bacterium]MCM1393328.1 hypothetical protein [[Eubacterium] siraeum]MCM1455912.1 hypothetical protein [Bacteroides sp.]